MLHEVQGDILLTGAQVIAQGVSPGDHFEQGLALSLRERWPAMYKDFRHFCQMQNPAPGGLWAWAGADGKRIVNLLTQEPALNHGHRPGRASVQHVNHALRELHKWALTEKISSLALPRLATGVGGLDWKDVQPLVQQHLGGLGIPVILYTTYTTGLKGKEPALAA
jgi:O-acetyl-ADP-ribose deacetylase (regulator of RNase III)